MGDGVELPLQFAVNSRPVESETFVIRFSPNILAVRTVLPEVPLCVELHSTFSGHRMIDTHASHLLLGPLGRNPEHFHAEHAHHSVNPVADPRSCVYAHVHQLIDVLSCDGRRLTVIDFADQVLTDLDQIPG